MGQDDGPAMAHETEKELILCDGDPKQKKILLLWLKLGVPLQVTWSSTPNDWHRLPSANYELFIDYFENYCVEDHRIWKLHNESKS